MVYFGGIIDVVHRVKGKWEWIDPQNIPVGDLSLYSSDPKGKRLELSPDVNLAKCIGKSIQGYQSERIEGRL